MEFEIINIEAIHKSPLQTEPYPYLKVVSLFPSLSKRGSFPLSALHRSGHFDQMIQELQAPELRKAIGDRFGLDLEGKPPMITVRGHTTERDGHIHVDSEDKLITVPIYFNSGWSSHDGKIRVLYNKSELSPEAGHCLIFQITPNCWHGYTAFEGERRSIQLNYVYPARGITSEAARE